MHAISPFYLDGWLTGEDLQTDMCMRDFVACGASGRHIEVGLLNWEPRPRRPYMIYDQVGQVVLWPPGAVASPGLSPPPFPPPHRARRDSLIVAAPLIYRTDIQCRNFLLSFFEGRSGPHLVPIMYLGW